MYEPEVTIITPTYNIIDSGHSDDFTLLVNLLNRQTYPYIEHIVMDNASTDETLEYLKEYKNTGYLNFYSAPDNGKYDAINKGLLRAKGKYIMILSCDDFIHDITAIAELVNAMEEENADYCCYNSYCVQDDGSAFLYEPSILNVFQVMPCPRQAIFFKKETLAKLGNFDAKFKLLAGYDMILRMVLNRCKGILLEQNLVTSKISENILKRKTQSEAECKHIFYKNYRNLYPMTDDIADRITKISEIPKPLLDKLAEYFSDSEEQFYEKYQIIYQMRLQAANALREAEREQRY